METIITKAIEGGYKPFFYENELVAKEGDSYIPATRERLICDPLFWKALFPKGATYEGELVPIWLRHAKQFHEKNLTEGFDQAVKWLEDIIK